MYVKEGVVKLSVVSHQGKEAVIGLLGPGDFLGEGSVSDQPTYLATATAMTRCKVLVIPKEQMVRILHEQPAFADRFVSYILARKVRIEQDLVDQLFNSTEKRLARAVWHARTSQHEASPHIPTDAGKHDWCNARACECFHE